MFANLFNFINRRRSAAYDQGFVREVRVARARLRSRRAERWIAVGWALIALKSAAIFWAVPRYHIPFSPWWVVAPTIAFAAVVTAIYFLWRE